LVKRKHTREPFIFQKCFGNYSKPRNYQSRLPTPSFHPGDIQKQQTTTSIQVHMDAVGFVVNKLLCQ